MARNENDEKRIWFEDGIIVNTSGSAAIVANATQTITISAVGPAAIGTATISKWLKITIDGVDYFIPLWT